MTDIDYGPLSAMTGTWIGDKGRDVSPEPDGVERNDYTETIHFRRAGDVDNAETQELVAVHYHLAVHRIRDGKPIHNQTGYWIWDAENHLVMHNFGIPRGVSVIAGGTYEGQTEADGSLVLEVSAAAADPDWQIVQSPFMREQATTTAFRQRLIIGEQRLDYEQTTLVDIYGQTSFEHTDHNSLKRQYMP